MTSRDHDFAETAVIVTGAASGMGHATAAVFAPAGANVLLAVDGGFLAP